MKSLWRPRISHPNPIWTVSKYLYPELPKSEFQVANCCFITIVLFWFLFFFMLMMSRFFMSVVEKGNHGDDFGSQRPGKCGIYYLF